MDDAKEQTTRIFRSVFTGLQVVVTLEKKKQLKLNVLMLMPVAVNLVLRLKQMINEFI